MSNAIEFDGVPSGDGECFCFVVSEETWRRVCGDEEYLLECEDRAKAAESDWAIERSLADAPWRLYPSDLLDALGVPDGKPCRLRIEAFLDPEGEQ